MRARLLLVGAGVVVTLGACSSSSKTSNSSSSSAAVATAAPTTTAAAPSSGTVDVATKAGVGQYLVDATGRSLYLFEKDTGTTSACTSSGCVSTWPALTSSAPPTVGAGLDASKASTAQGQVANQVVYNGHLLYLFSHDSSPGDTNGTKITGWHLVSPAGTAMGGS